MALVIVPAPLGVMDAFQDSMVDLFGPHDDANLTFHLPVGSLDAEELLNGALLPGIAESGCRILSAWGEFVPGLEGAITLCEVSYANLPQPPEFRSFSAGDIPEMALSRVSEARELDSVKTEDFELHFLSIPEIQLQALRLVCIGPGSDLILPVLSADPRLTTVDILRAEDFLVLARTIAAERLALERAELSS